MLGRNIHLFSSVVWKEPSLVSEFHAVCLHREGSHCQESSSPEWRTEKTWGMLSKYPVRLWLVWSQCPVSLRSRKLDLKSVLVWAVYIFTFLCVFVVAQVASANACRWHAAASTISRTGSTCLPNTHTLRWHPHTRLSPSATRWGCTHYSFILVHCTCTWPAFLLLPPHSCPLTPSLPPDTQSLTGGAPDTPTTPYLTPRLMAAAQCGGLWSRQTHPNPGAWAASVLRLHSGPRLLSARRRCCSLISLNFKTNKQNGSMMSHLFREQMHW